MKFNKLECQICKRTLTENSMFGWIQRGLNSPIKIYDLINGIYNPNNLQCTIVYCNSCSHLIDEMAFKAFNTGVSDWHISWFNMQSYIDEINTNPKSLEFKEDFYKIYNILN